MRDESSHLNDQAQCSHCKEWFEKSEVVNTVSNQYVCTDCESAIAPIKTLENEISNFYQGIGKVDLNKKFEQFFSELNRKGVDENKTFNVEIFRIF